jgi:hypothetical protein
MRSAALAVLVRQGVWAWITVVAAEGHAQGRRPAPAAPPCGTVPTRPSCAPAAVTGALLGAWTDLIVGAMTHQEAPV